MSAMIQYFRGGSLGARVLRQMDLPWTVIRFYVWNVHAVLVFGLVFAVGHMVSLGSLAGVLALVGAVIGLDPRPPVVALAALIAGELPDARGRFGPFGGRYVPETLVPAMPPAELVFTIKAIGLESATWLLELATPEQVTAALDLDAARGEPETNEALVAELGGASTDSRPAGRPLAALVDDLRTVATSD